MPIDINNNEDLSASIRTQVEQRLTSELSVLVGPALEGYQIRIGAGGLWVSRSIAAHNPYLPGWGERLTRIVHNLVQEYAHKRFLK